MTKCRQHYSKFAACRLRRRPICRYCRLSQAGCLFHSARRGVRNGRRMSELRPVRRYNGCERRLEVPPVPAVRPTAASRPKRASEATVCYVCNTSTPAVPSASAAAARCAQIAAADGGLDERGMSAPFLLSTSVSVRKQRADIVDKVEFLSPITIHATIDRPLARFIRGIHDAHRLLTETSNIGSRGHPVSAKISAAQMPEFGARSFFDFFNNIRQLRMLALPYRARLTEKNTSTVRTEASNPGSNPSFSLGFLGPLGLWSSSRLRGRRLCPARARSPPDPVAYRTLF